MTDMTGIIIAGGKSQRMGRDKAFIPYKGKLLISYAIDLLNLFCDKLIISNNQPDKFDKYALQNVEDIYENIGPLGGLQAALSYSKSDTNIVIPCDMPLIREELISYLLKRHKPNYITVPIHNGYLEPLCAIYPKTAIATIESMIQQDNFKLHNLLNQHPTQKIDVKHIINQFPDMLNNFNHPTDL